MHFCNVCHSLMINITSFSRDGNERYCRCPKCFSESKHKKIKDSEIPFGEVMNREIDKRR